MSESYKPAGRLTRPPKTVGQLRIEAASAQRALNDSGFIGLIDEMQEDAADSALFNTDPAIREENRVKVITIGELRARLQLAAAHQEDQREDSARASTFE